MRHFEVGYGFDDRGDRLRSYLETLWDGDTVEVRRCEACGFGFAWPHRAGDAAFYNLVTGADPEYPQDRWEFGRTAEALATDRSLTLLEAGAGDGAFLALLRDRLPGLDALALEYDDGALAALRERGFEASGKSLEELAADPAHHARYDVICAFQALEHMDRPHDVLAAIDSLLAERGHVFLSVPNGAAIDAQERLTGFQDMPPNHVGRWSRSAFEAWIAGSRFQIAEDDLEPPDSGAFAGAYAGQRLMADRYSRRSLPSLAEHARHPIAVDVLTKRRRRRYEEEGRRLGSELLPPTYWIHLEARS